MQKMTISNMKTLGNLSEKLLKAITTFQKLRTLLTISGIYFLTLVRLYATRAELTLTNFHFYTEAFTGDFHFDDDLHFDILNPEKPASSVLMVTERELPFPPLD